MQDQADDLGRATLTATRRYALKSRAVDQTFIINVARPAHRVPDAQRLPVVYVLDGDGAFGVAAQAARMMQMEAGGLPPMLIAGIGYRYSLPRLAMAEHGAWRTRDFSPSLDVASRARTHAALREAGFSAEVDYGGASAFLTFINDELKPFIAEQYAADPNDQTLVGMSLGGLFALHAMFNSPTSFKRYVVLSPALRRPPARVPRRAIGRPSGAATPAIRGRWLRRSYAACEPPTRWPGGHRR